MKSPEHHESPVRNTASHAWRTVSRHLSADGETRYQSCFCGRWRILVNGLEHWRSGS